MESQETIFFLSKIASLPQFSSILLGLTKLKGKKKELKTYNTLLTVGL